MCREILLTQQNGGPSRGSWGGFYWKRCTQSKEGPLYCFRDAWMAIFALHEAWMRIYFFRNSWIYTFSSLGNWFSIFSWSVKYAFTFAWFVNERLLGEWFFTFLEILASLKLVNYAKLDAKPAHSMRLRIKNWSITDHSDSEPGWWA